MKNDINEQIIKNTDIDFVNKMIEKSEIEDFKLSKTTLANISGWALNGASDTEIRKNLDLNKKQWAILCSVCPALIMVMQNSRAMADMVIAGSLFQTAIGGKRIKKQVPVKVKDYDYDEKSGKSWVIGEHTEIQEIEEELPPNPILLKFLAEHKLSEQFGEKKDDKTNRFKEMVENLSPEDKALIDAARKSGGLDGEN